MAPKLPPPAKTKAVLGWVWSPGMDALLDRRLLHRQLGLKIFAVAEYRGDGEHASFVLESQQAILGIDIALDRDLVPLLGVADVVDRYVVVLAPEERHRVESLAKTEHVACRGLALTFGHHPMLNANVRAGMRVGPARDIARRVDAGNAR